MSEPTHAEVTDSGLHDGSIEMTLKQRAVVRIGDGLKWLDLVSCGNRVS